jgi:LAS superfamily LD-carboxypeptidase LdcB
MNAAELTGQAGSHIAEVREPPCLLHVDAITAFLRMRAAAGAAGMDLAAISSFRDFARQLAIWNGKFNGERPINDADGVPVAAESLTAEQRVDAILLWSALPGASRHHWGTDVDLIDRNATLDGYRAQLVPAEFAADGPFADLAQWLEANAAHYGFFRPYKGVRSGVQAEPWHYSFAPIAEPARKRLSIEVLRTALNAAPLAGKDQVMARMEELHQRYVARIDWP